jgi:hypothetical protein
LAASPEGRRHFASPWPWIAAGIAIVVFSLNIVWNAQHDWLTFAKQFGRIAPLAFQPRYTVELVVGQALLLNPLIAFCAARCAVRRCTNSLDLRPFACVAAPFALYLLIHSLHDRVQAHWPAPLYPIAAICAAAGAERMAGRWQFVARAALPFGIAVGGAALAVLAAPGAWFGRYDLALPVRGWTAFTSRLEDLRVANGASWVGTTSYGLAAELADEPGLHAPVVQLAERERWRGLAHPGTETLSAPGLIVDLGRRLNPAHMAGCFSTVTPLGDVRRGDQDETGKVYAAFAVSGPRRDLLADGCPGL